MDVAAERAGRPAPGVDRPANDDRAAMVSVLARASYKWSVLIILLLGDGPKRFTEIRHGVGGITHKVLSQTLRTLEREGLIRGMSLHAGLARSDYELTCLGRLLRAAVEPLGAWAQTHVRDVSEARAEYDKRQRKEEQRAVTDATVVIPLD